MAEECFETVGSEQDWKGRLLLCEDDDDNDDGSDGLDSGDDESNDSNRGNSVGDEEWWSIDSNNGYGMVEVSGDSGVGEPWVEEEHYGDINVEMDPGNARRDDCDIGSGGGGEEKCCTDQEARECIGVEERREEEQHYGCGGSNDIGDVSGCGEGTSDDSGGNGCGEGESKCGIGFAGGVGGEERQDSQKGGRTSEVHREHNPTSPQTRAAFSMTQVLEEDWDKIDPNIPLDPNWV